MTRTKAEIKERIKTNVPKIWNEYPYALGAFILVSLVVGGVLGAWLT